VESFVRAGAAAQNERLPLEVVSLLLRRRTFYMVEIAGAQIGLSRTQSYVAAAEGLIPTERYGRLRLVRRTVWDAKVKELRRGSGRPGKVRPQSENAAPIV
jgi:hypothetical protein